MKTTAFEIKLALLEYYRFGSQCVSVDEFNGADVIADTGKEIIEIEVKITKHDLVNGEKQKRLKHICYGQGRPFKRCYPNKFLFAVPMDLVEVAEHVVFDLNPKYGIIGFDAEAFEAHVQGNSFVPYLKNYLCSMKRARRLHTNYGRRQTRLIAKRCSAKLITLLQKQHTINVDNDRGSWGHE